MEVIAVVEYDYEDKETDIIGVADSEDNANKLIQDYYGDEHVVLETFYDDNVLWSGVICEKQIEALNFDGKPYKVKVTLETYQLNEA